MSQSHSSQVAGGGIGPYVESHDYHREEYFPDRSRTSDLETFRSKPAKSSLPKKNVGDSERVLSFAAGAGLGLIGVLRGGLSGLALGAVGAALTWRGYSGHCTCYSALGISTAKRKPSTAVPARQGCKLEKTIVVGKSPQELYRFWRRFENLPHVMRHLKWISTLDDFTSHWVAEGAFGKDVEWDAEIINERENEMIAWRSLPGGDIDTAGSVHFEPVSHNRGTKVTVSMKYNPPAGKIGIHLASLFGDGLEYKLNEDLRTFKQVMETGMAPAPATV